ncbi:MAG TPA: hypothetical protein VKE69_11520, partial [Planctomycetota bacterium]|nr:hypothetical protein [Planctomycetota bacterium]
FGLVRWLLSKVAAAEKKSWNDGGPDANRKPRVSTTEFHDALAALDRAVRESGGKLVLVCPPRMPAQEKEIPVVLDYTEAVHATAKELAAPLAEVRDAMRAKDEPLAKRNAAGDVSQLFHDVVHPSADGHRAYAEVVAATLADAGLLAAGASR